MCKLDTIDTDVRGEVVAKLSSYPLGRRGSTRPAPSGFGSSQARCYGACGTLRGSPIRFCRGSQIAKLPKGLRPYDLRHTAVTRWVQRYSGAIAQKAAGHASFKTTERYIHLNDAALDVLIEAPKASEKAS